MEQKLIINIGGPTTDYYDSYGQKICELVRGLSARGVHCNVFPVSGELVRDNQPADVQDLLRRPVRPATGGILLGYPTLHVKFPAMFQAGPLMAITAWESTVPPVGWVEALNRVDAVSVGSIFTRDVLIMAGVDRQIHVHPLGISDVYQYVERPKKRRPFTLLAYASGGTRKGWDVALAAFYRAFGTDQRFRLVLKTRPGQFKFALPQKNMDVLSVDYTQQEMAELFARVDAFVFPTRGEGFGLPPREAAATGLPVIVTKWGGTADDLQQWGYPIRLSGLTTAFPHNMGKIRGCGEWAEPDVDHCAEQMRHVALSNRNLIRAVAQRSARNVRRLYNWQTFADSVLKVYREQAAKYPLSKRRKRQYEKAGRVVI
jgi:glycosyltransferase involved in cell wall biosynthesis